MTITTKKKQKVDDKHQVRIYNKSKQTIMLEACVPGGDFYIHRQQLHIKPGKHVMIYKSYLNKKQIENLVKKGFISIIYDGAPK